MKKFVMVLAIVAVVAMLCMTIVACNEKPTTSTDQNEYEVAKYTVTFVTNGDIVLTNSVLKDVVSGSKIQPPTDKDGNVVTPVKKGYTFQFWSADGTTAFDFEKDVITKNTTLTAIYTNNVYQHTPVLTAKLVYNDDGTYSVDTNGYEEGYATLSVAELDASTTSIKSTYAGAVSYLACPNVEDENDSFCFWYYIDNDGKPVQFTKWANTGDANVAMLAKYYFAHPLTLYPMYYSNLPRVSVVYRDSVTETVYNEQEISYAIGDDIPVGDCIASPTRAGYLFDEWYYITVDDDGVESQNTFVFAQQGASATSILGASMIDDYFTNGVLRLYARWTKQISIASVADFNNLSQLLHTENPTDDQKAEIDEVLNAKIFVSSIDFGGVEILPLFENYTFAGKIDGGTYSGSSLTANAVLSNAVVCAAQDVSIFGKVNGTLSNVNCQNITLSPQKDGDYFQNTVYVGTLASTNGGEIANCHIFGTIFNLDGATTVVYGGICAVNSGTNGINTKGYIHDCSVEILSLTYVGEGFVFGGITAQSNASSRLVNNTTNVHIASVVCKDDGISANGKPMLRIGGIAGSSSATMSRQNATLVIDSVSGVGETFIGGVVAQNNGALSTLHASVVVGNSEAPVIVNPTLTQFAYIGGLIGTNEGTLINSYCDASIYVSTPSTTGVVAVGGLIGSNYSDKKDSSTTQTTGIGCINKSYATGEIVITSTAQTSALTVYAGGIAGRNSQKKIASNFAIVNISISGNGTNNIGYLFGSMEKSASITSGWYSNQTVLSVNGVAYDNDNFDIIKTGASTEQSLFTDSSWVFEQDGSLGWDATIWAVADDGTLPTLR